METSSKPPRELAEVGLGHFVTPVEAREPRSSGPSDGGRAALLLRAGLVEFEGVVWGGRTASPHPWAYQLVEPCPGEARVVCVVYRRDGQAVTLDFAAVPLTGDRHKSGKPYTWGNQEHREVGVGDVELEAFAAVLADTLRRAERQVVDEARRLFIPEFLPETAPRSALDAPVRPPETDDELRARLTGSGPR